MINNFEIMQIKYKLHTCIHVQHVYLEDIIDVFTWTTYA